MAKPMLRLRRCFPRREPKRRERLLLTSCELGSGDAGRGDEGLCRFCSFSCLFHRVGCLGNRFPDRFGNFGGGFLSNLDRFLDGTSISGGTLFADYACPSDFSGLNTIIYGHNMKDGSMFALIDDYAYQTFYEEHPVMYLNTPSQNYRVDIFSCFTTDPESFVYTPAFASEEEYEAFLSRVLAYSEISCGIEPSPGSRIVTLSTCAYTGDDVRFVVCGVLTEIG